MSDAINNLKEYHTQDVLMNYLNLPMSSTLMQKIGFIFCVKRVVNLSENELYRIKALEYAKSFMEKTLM